jgi:hypothetical protein
MAQMEQNCTDDHLGKRRLKLQQLEAAQAEQLAMKEKRREQQR